MPRPPQLSSDNLLRFLQVRRDPASTEDIAAGLHMRRADRHALYKMLGKLKKRGLIEEVPGGRYRLAGRNEEQRGDGQGGGERSRSAGEMPGRAERRSSGTGGSAGAAAHDQIEGRLVLHHDGFGFVVPSVPVPGLDRDVFIPRDAVEDAMHGDRVLVKLQRVTGAGESQRTEGRIVRVLGRE